MDNYSIDLFTRLDDFRCNFENDNIYCYQLLILFANEIFIRHDRSDEIYLSLQENLKVTIEAILNFNNTDTNINNNSLNDFNINNIEDYINLLRHINSVLDEQDNYFIENENIILCIKKILNSIEHNDDNNIEVNEDMKFLINECKEDYFEKKEEKIENNNFNFNNNILNDNYLKEFILRKNIISEEEYKCSKCGITHWNDYPIPLKLIYVDKNEYNQNIDNIKFLCPNCYSIFKI